MQGTTFDWKNYVYSRALYSWMKQYPLDVNKYEKKFPFLCRSDDLTMC